MATIELLPRVGADFGRFLVHMRQHDIADAPERIADIVAALQILETSPLIGRPVRGGKRELVIGQGSRGYVALYRHLRREDKVIVLAIRNQRESGFKRGG